MTKYSFTKIVIFVMILVLVLVGCNKKNDNTEESDSQSDSQSSEETSEVEKEAESITKEFKNLEYTAMSNWEFTETEDTLVISIDNNKANILIAAKEDDKAGEYTQEDLQSGLLYILEQTSSVDDTKITSDAVVDEVKIMDVSAAYLNFDINMKGVEGKIILYSFVLENYVYNIEYSSLLEDAEIYVRIFDDFVNSLKLKA